MSFLKYLIPATLLAGLPTLAYAGSHASGNLDPSDFVGISFWIISIAMVAATVWHYTLLYEYRVCATYLWRVLRLSSYCGGNGRAR